MCGKHKNDIHQINYLISEIDALYHVASLKLGISDSVSVVLYTIYDEGSECLLKDIYKKSGTNKQTVNSAVRTLEKDGILFLKNHDGKSKKAVLTDKGKEFAENTAAKIYRAEEETFDTWSKNEIEAYIKLLDKYAETFRRQVEKIKQP